MCLFLSFSLSFSPPIILGLSFVPKSFFFSFLCFRCQLRVPMFALKLFLLCLLCQALSVGSSSPSVLCLSFMLRFIRISATLVVIFLWGFVWVIFAFSSFFFFLFLLKTWNFVYAFNFPPSFFPSFFFFLSSGKGLKIFSGD